MSWQIEYLDVRNCRRNTMSFFRLALCQKLSKIYNLNHVLSWHRNRHLDRSQCIAAPFLDDCACSLITDNGTFVRCHSILNFQAVLVTERFEGNTIVRTMPSRFRTSTIFLTNIEMSCYLLRSHFKPRCDIVQRLKYQGKKFMIPFVKWFHIYVKGKLSKEL